MNDGRRGLGLAKESTKTFISYEKISRLSSRVRSMCGKSVGTMSETKIQSHEKRLRKAGMFSCCHFSHSGGRTGLILRKPRKGELKADSYRH